ncbi:retrotransposon protein, putative, ty1-copia subclass [Tanacetum coccineum]
MLTSTLSADISSLRFLGSSAILGNFSSMSLQPWYNWKVPHYSKPYTRQVERAKDLLGLIHTDVCGPFKIMSRQGASYFVTFTDDFSRYGYVYLLKHKHEVFETFKVFQKEVENQLGKTIKSLRFDRGGEYTSQEFLDNLRDHGIIAHRTPSYTPQHNGVSKRRNRTLLDMVRSMMSQTTLPKSFWDYALETAARILNMVPTKKVEKTPYEVWHGQAPKLSYLKETNRIYFLLPTPEKQSLAAQNTKFPKNNLFNLKKQVDSFPSYVTRTRKWPQIVCAYTSMLRSMKMQSMKDNEVWDLVDLPPNGKNVGSKWLFKKKTDMDGVIHTYKACHVAKGYTQTSWIDYEKTFSHHMQNIPYASAVGSIMYAVRCTHPDVAFTQNITSRFQQNPGDLHWTTVKNILKYPRNTKDMFLVNRGDIKRELGVSCYTNAGYLTDADDLKSHTRYVFVLNREAEYIATYDASKEAVWVRKFISRLGIFLTIEETINMYSDNTGAITIANEFGITKGARHFRAKVYYLRKVIEFGDIKLEKVHTDDNLVILLLKH